MTTTPVIGSLPPSSRQSALKIIYIFLGVRAILYAIAFFTPYLYDTSSYSTSLLFKTDGSDTIFGARLAHLIRRLTIWDNVFFTTGASRSANGFPFKFEQDVMPDSSFFVKMTQGYIYEHEWAFGYGWMQLIRFFGRLIYRMSGRKGDPLYYYSIAAISIGNLAHLGACFLLYILTFKVYFRCNTPVLVRVLNLVKSNERIDEYSFRAAFGDVRPITMKSAPAVTATTSSAANKTASGVSSNSKNRKNRKSGGGRPHSKAQSQHQPQEKVQKQQVKGQNESEKFELSPSQLPRKLSPGNVQRIQYCERVASRAAMLYALTPAGIFMASGYSEPLFALLSFSAMFLREDLKYSGAGLIFAMSTLIRSNGLLWGIFYAYDVILNVKILYHSYKNRYSRKVVVPSIVSFTINMMQGGFLVTVAFAVSQILAYWMYCPQAEWCTARNGSGHGIVLPMIYPYIQSKYWNIGFLKYWTPNNIPNFLFALPTLILMTLSCWYFLRTPKYIDVKIDDSDPDEIANVNKVSEFATYSMTPYILISGVMMFSALFVWHVQTITRIASCIPIIYWFGAEMITSSDLKQVKIGKAIVQYFFVWIIIQGIFYASFLPPA